MDPTTETVVLRVIKSPREHISAAIMRVCAAEAVDPRTIIAVIPSMLTFFATSPERWEVTEVDVIARR